MCRTNRLLLKYLENGNFLLNTVYHNLRVDTDAGEDHQCVGSYNEGRRSGLLVGVMWLEGAISLLEIPRKED